MVQVLPKGTSVSNSGEEHPRKQVFAMQQEASKQEASRSGQQLRQLLPRRHGGTKPSGESVLTNWVGHLVVVKYLAVPAAPADPDELRNLAIAQLEVRSGIFHLQRFGQLGIEVCNTMEDGMLNRVTFIPWGSVLSIRGTTPQERAQGGGKLTREQVAQLAQRDNI